MADTYETKKINELSEATSAENSDLMMVGNPTSGQTSKITKENLMKDINTSLTQATNDIAENKIAIEQNASDITEINSALAELNTTVSNKADSSDLSKKQNTLSTEVLTVEDISISATSNYTANYDFPSSSYNYIGTLGYRISNSSSSGSGASSISVYAVRVLSSAIDIALRNTSSSAAKVNLQIYLLRTSK